MRDNVNITGKRPPIKFSPRNTTRKRKYWKSRNVSMSDNQTNCNPNYIIIFGFDPSKCPTLFVPNLYRSFHPFTLYIYAPEVPVSNPNILSKASFNFIFLLKPLSKIFFLALQQKIIYGLFGGV